MYHTKNSAVFTQHDFSSNPKILLFKDLLNYLLYNFQMWTYMENVEINFAPKPIMVTIFALKI